MKRVTVLAHRLRPMITKNSIETAYSFLHQKRFGEDITLAVERLEKIAYE